MNKTVKNEVEKLFNKHIFEIHEKFSSHSEEEIRCMYFNYGNSPLGLHIFEMEMERHLIDDTSRWAYLTDHDLRAGKAKCVKIFKHNLGYVLKIYKVKETMRVYAYRLERMKSLWIKD